MQQPHQQVSFASKVFSVHAADCEADLVVVAHWREMWLEAGMEHADFKSDFQECTLSFIHEARRSLDYQTFIARCGDGKIIGSASCQAWSGPVPLVVKPRSFKLGTVWAVYVQPGYRRCGIAACLMEAVKDHWRKIGCLRGVLLHATTAGRAVYESVGFTSGNLLLIDLKGKHLQVSPHASPACSGVYIEAAGSEADDVVVKHWRCMWQDAGMPISELKQESREITLAFIQQARMSLQYQTFVACNEAGDIIGSASCQVWSGPLPLVLKEDVFKLGTVWAVYVQPEYRRQGVAGKLMEHCIAYWKDIGCQKGILLYASPGGCRIYQRLGFESANGMVIDLVAPSQAATTSDTSSSHLPNTAATFETVCAAPLHVSTCEASGSDTTASTPRKEEAAPLVGDDAVSLALGKHPADSGSSQLVEQVVDALKAAGISGDDYWLRLLAHALPQQLEAAFGDRAVQPALHETVISVQREHGIYIEPSDNWFTQNVKRFGGGFDMKQLTSEPGMLAAKFDRLSGKYDQWTVGNRSRVEDWLTQQARQNKELLGTTTACILDVACGIGLPAHQLRLCGYQSHIVGLDLSPGMIECSRSRGVYDSLHVANANEGLTKFDSDSVDLVVCTGAMELLDHAIVLHAFARVLKIGGQLWVSFQFEDPSSSSVVHPTAHQNVFGVTHAELKAELGAAGFVIEDMQCCENAFYTPSPSKDGTLLPVPYVFVRARFEGS